MNSEPLDRRGFLKTLLRTGALAGLAAVAAGALARRKGACAQRANACAACDRLAHCGQPQAGERRSRMGAAMP